MDATPNPDGPPAMGDRDGGRRGASGSMAASVGFARASLAAIADLETRLPLGMGPLEAALAARLRAAIAQLLDCAEELAAAELMIRGSTGQKRPHPLLKTLADLR